MGFRLVRGLFIRTTATPNPSFLKFIPGTTVMQEGTLDIPGLRYAHVSPLARELFQIEGVTRVFYGKDYISIGKTEKSDWAVLKPLIFASIMDHFTSEKPLLTDAPPAEDTKVLETDSESVAIIKEILEGRVRPFVQEDGGDIKYVGFDQESGTVTLEMRGSCSGCPSSSVTLKNGIEKMLVHYVPEVKKVEAVEFDDAKE